MKAFQERMETLRNDLFTMTLIIVKSKKLAYSWISESFMWHLKYLNLSRDEHTHKNIIEKGKICFLGGGAEEDYSANIINEKK